MLHQSQLLPSFSPQEQSSSATGTSMRRPVLTTTTSRPSARRESIHYWHWTKPRKLSHRGLPLRWLISLSLHTGQSSRLKRKGTIRVRRIILFLSSSDLADRGPATACQGRDSRANARFSTALAAV